MTGWRPRMRRMLDAVLARPDDEETVIRARVGISSVPLEGLHLTESARRQLDSAPGADQREGGSR